MVEDFGAYKQYLQKWTNDEISTDEEIAQALSYATRLAETWKHRCFIVTDTGQMGLASQSCQTGDKVCKFQTAKTPFILRPIEVSDNSTLVSDAYVDAAMYGEVLKQDNVELEYFILE